MPQLPIPYELVVLVDLRCVRLEGRRMNVRLITAGICCAVIFACMYALITHVAGAR